MARLALTVDLPTPPFPEATASTFLTPARLMAPSRTPLDTLAVTLRSICSMPGSVRIAFLTSVSICARRGQAGVVSTTVSATLPPQTRTS